MVGPAERGAGRISACVKDAGALAAAAVSRGGACRLAAMTQRAAAMASSARCSLISRSRRPSSSFSMPTRIASSGFGAVKPVALARPPSGSEEAGDLAVPGDLDMVGGGNARQARHRQDLAADGHHEFGAGRKAQLAHRNDVPRGRTLLVRIGREAVLRLGDADREMAEPLLLQLREAVPDALVGGDVAGAIK